MTNRRGFLTGAASLAAYTGFGNRLFGATRPQFGFDVSKCNVSPRLKNCSLFSGEPVCGVNFGFMAKRGYYSLEKVKAMPKQMREAGVNWCMVNTHFCSETFASTKMFFDPVYSSGEIELTEIVKRLRGEGIHVALKPCITTLDSSWMGRICFPHQDDHQIQGNRKCAKYWPEWFGSLRETLKCFAEFAEKNGVEAALIGAEYTGTLRDQDREWTKTAAAFRQDFSGPIAYEFTCDPEPGGSPSVNYEWTQKIGFIDKLDFLALSWYPRARPFEGMARYPKLPKTSVDEMVAYLKAGHAQFDKLCKRYGDKPVLFTETGVRSAHGCISLPWDAFSETTYDAQEQADYMEALYRVFSEKPQFAGMFWWKWDETQKRDHYDPDPRKDRGFTICGKPACDVFRKWSGRGI